MELGLGGAAMGLAACRLEGSSGPDPDGSGPGPTLSDEIGFVGDNHQHDAFLSKAQLEAGLPLTLSIQGHSSHDHFVSLTAADLAAIRDGFKVAKVSTNDWGHEHLVTFNRTA